MISIGDYITAKLITQISNTQWKVDCPKLQENVHAVLVSRSAKIYNQNDEEAFWIFDIIGNQILLSDSNFGRLPISDRMRPRYIHSLQSVLTFLNSPEDFSSIKPEDISEVKGLLNRCVRKDQWDWFTVYSAIGYPPISYIAEVARVLGDLAKACKNSEKTETMIGISKLLESNVKGIFEKGLARILESNPRLSFAKQFSSTTNSNFGISKKTDDTENDPYIISQIARVKLERANKLHEDTLQILIKVLQQNGFYVEFTRLIDAYCRLKTGPAIFEVKSISPDNERAQFRHALSQLYEYRYLHSIPDSSLWLVLSNPPVATWLVDYFEDDRKVGVLWVENGTLIGRSYKRLLAKWSGDNTTLEGERP